MPHISRKKLSTKTESELINALNYVFTKIDNDEQMLLFLQTLLTETEKLMLAKRLAIIILLGEGLNDARISEILHVTRITVAKMRFYNEARGHGFKQALNILAQHKSYAQYKKLLLSLTRYTIRAAGGHVKPGILD